MAGCGGGKMIPKYKDGGIVKVQTGSTRPPYRGPVPNREGMDYTGTINGKDSYRDFGGREYVDSDNKGSMRQTRASMNAVNQANNPNTPVPGQFTPTEIAKQNRDKEAQMMKEAEYKKMDDKMKRAGKR